MSTGQPSQVTQLANAASQGDEAARKRLWELIGDDLHRMAQGQMANEAPGRTLQATALLNEAYLRVMGGENLQWNSRRHLYAAFAENMRRILVDDARRRNRLKRGGGEKVASLRVEPGVSDQHPGQALAIDDALGELGQVDPRKVEVVVLRYRCGLTVDECASALGVSPRTVDSDWRFARVWLRRHLSSE